MGQVSLPIIRDNYTFVHNSSYAICIAVPHVSISPVASSSHGTIPRHHYSTGEGLISNDKLENPDNCTFDLIHFRRNTIVS